MNKPVQRPFSSRHFNPCRKIVRRGALFLAAAGFLCAQAPGPDTEDVSMGHIHLIAKNPQLSKRVWVDVLGATPAMQGALDGVRLKGTYVWIEKDEPVGGTHGSVIRDIGVRVGDLDGVLVRAARGGFHARQASRNSAELRAPDNVLLELLHDGETDTEVRIDHVHFLVPDAGLARRWYTERFGPSSQGARLEFITSGASAAPTKGRAMDHIGFEVKSLDSYLDPVKAISWESPPTETTDVPIRSAFLTDPWGTRIELTEQPRRR
jgi:hypothetical protein